MTHEEDEAKKHLEQVARGIWDEHWPASREVEVLAELIRTERASAEKKGREEGLKEMESDSAFVATNEQRISALREVSSLKEEIQRINQFAFQHEESLKKRLQLMGEKLKEWKNGNYELAKLDGWNQAIEESVKVAGQVVRGFGKKGEIGVLAEAEMRLNLASQLEKLKRN